MEEKLIDNKQYGRVGDVLKRNIKENSKLSITASYFTLYAFQELKEELFNLRFANATGNLEKPSRIKEIRKTIARIKMVIREREINNK